MNKSEILAMKAIKEQNKAYMKTILEMEDKIADLIELIDFIDPSCDSVILSSARRLIAPDERGRE